MMRGTGLGVASRLKCQGERDGQARRVRLPLCSPIRCYVCINSNVVSVMGTYILQVLRGEILVPLLTMASSFTRQR
jgi:hypothetical protein